MSSDFGGWIRPIPRQATSSRRATTASDMRSRRESGSARISPRCSSRSWSAGASELAMSRRGSFTAWLWHQADAFRHTTVNTWTHVRGFLLPTKGTYTALPPKKDADPLTGRAAQEGKDSPHDLQAQHTDPGSHRHWRRPRGPLRPG